MNFEQWCVQNGFVAAELTDVQRTALEASFKAQTKPKETPKLEDVLEAAKKEEARREKITQLVAAFIGERPSLIDVAEAISRQAIEGKWTEQQTELELLRAGRNVGASISLLSRGTPDISGKVIEAALCKEGNYENLEKDYDAATLEAMDKHFRHGLSIGELILMGARRSGYRGNSLRSNLPDALRAAFRADPERGIRAEGTSTYTIPDIVSNVANKFLRVGFEAVDQAWRRMSAIRSVKDFKQTTTVALTGGEMYGKVAPSGELKHGSIGDRVYNNQASTYGTLLAISRTDLINDDTGALTSAGRRVGRGGALKLNDLFWSTFLNNSSFFTSGNNNVSTGAGSALGLAGLQTADSTFRTQTDPDGFPLGVQPTLLVVPSALRITAMNLMNSTFIVSGNTTGLPNSNSFAGAYDVVSSPYMSNSSYTGNSTAAWYLLADPNDLPVIEVAFLNGVEMPTVETTQAEFEILGIAMRGFFDFGVATQEFRGGVRSNGS